MTKETKIIEVPAYRDNSGNPCCAMDFSTGEVCPFYRTQKFGGLETCVFAEDRGKYKQTMYRRAEGLGTLIPLDACPIWNKDQYDK